ncbi:hypothetical protein BDD12DRAFT_875621 [Trichophaea hybrida]|nr:hypothetical protein BDD12DRAFT_875621 [Trichophaea hybrida]
MNEQQRQTFTTVSKRRNIKLQRIFDDTKIDRPCTIPASRRPPLIEVNNHEEKNGRRRRRKKGMEFKIFEDPEKEVTRERRTGIQDPPLLPPPPPPPQEPAPRISRMRTSVPSLPPTALTALLLSHANAHPPLPPLPTPPRSRLPHKTRSSVESLPLPSPPASLQSHPRVSTKQHSQLSSFTLESLPSLQHHSEHAIISLSPPTHLTVTLRGSPYTYRIAPSSPPIITVTDRPAQSRTIYSLPDLPYKHLPAFRYARSFVASVRRRTLLAYGGIEGAQGRVWADGRGVVTFAGGVEVDILPSGEVKTLVEGKNLVEEAKRVYNWLLQHPRPVYDDEEEEEEEWRRTEETRFVRDVGWCQELARGRWRMKFLDGVGLEIGDGGVIWIRDGVRTREKAGLRDPDVRKRVAEFVKAGL